MEITFEYGGVSSTSVRASETWKSPPSVELEILGKSMQVKRKNKPPKIFKLQYFTLHSSHVCKGKLSLRFQKEDTSVFVVTTPEEAQQIVDEILEVKGGTGTTGAESIKASSTALKRPHQSYAELTIKSTPVKKKTNSFASPHRLQNVAFSPSVGRQPQAKSPLSEEQRKIVDCVVSGASVFFTGGAGTGKSFLLQKLVKMLDPRTTAVTASTGLAACHLNGITLHHWGGIGIGTADIEVLIQRLKRNSGLMEKLSNAKTLIIDEISMVDGNYFDKLEVVVRTARGNSKPWGGLQLVICGDFLQLPPVGNTTDVKFCFEASSWKKSIHKTFLLNASFRQSGDQRFIELLNEVREGRCSHRTAELLGRLLRIASKPERGTTRLLPLRKEVDEINQQELAKLPGDQELFTATDQVYESDFNLDAAASAKKSLALKLGAQVILTKTLSVEDKLVNGALGIVTRFTSNPRTPIVKFALTGKEIPVSPEDWIFTSNGREVARRRQIPLDLAWGVSIHKSQGMTIDSCELSLDGIFEFGQAYVGMSRCRSLDGLRLLSKRFTADSIRQVIKTNPKCLAFYQSLKENSIS